MILTRLNINNCIILGDARRLKSNKTPVRNMRGLSLELEKLPDEPYDSDKIYKVLHRANQRGIGNITPRLLQDIKDILMVTDVELITYPQN